MELSGRNILLLQGPMGPFFWHLRARLECLGATVHKVNFNGGDVLFYPWDATAFRAPLEDWSVFLRRLIQERDIDQIFLFGDCREHHRIAVKAANALGVRVMVFEEGYLRPHYITVEEEGVNGHSPLPRSPEFYLSQQSVQEEQTKKFAHPFARMAIYAIVYYLAAWATRFLFPGYRHHRAFCPWRESVVWLRSAWRKRCHKPQSRKMKRLLRGEWSKRYFLVPLQVHNDAQISHHSSIGIGGFLTEVLASFARHAPPETFLIVKHHPMDRGYSDYTALISTLAARHGLGGRVVYTWDAHLPTALKHALGTVLINSTTGLQSLYHHTPVKTLGRAIYDMPGLTCQASLDRFWREPGSVDTHLYKQFRSYLLGVNQFNGSFSYPPTSDLVLDWCGQPCVQQQTSASVNWCKRALCTLKRCRIEGASVAEPGLSPKGLI
jgi:capsule polysaccharide modification protein KpsS